MGAFLLPTLPSLCAPPLPSSLLEQYQPPGHRVCNTPSLNPISSTSPSRCCPPPYFAQPLCTLPPLIFTWATLTPLLLKHAAPLNASCGASQHTRVTLASCHPPPLINALCGTLQCAGTNADGSLDCYKARMVAKGYS